MNYGKWMLWCYTVTISVTLPVLVFAIICYLFVVTYENINRQYAVKGQKLAFLIVCCVCVIVLIASAVMVILFDRTR